MNKTACHCYVNRPALINPIDHYDMLAYHMREVRDTSQHNWISIKRALINILKKAESGNLSSRFGICANIANQLNFNIEDELSYLFLKVSPFHSEAYPIGGKSEYNDFGLSRWEGLQLEARIEMLYALITQVEIEINACDLVK